MFNWSQSTSGGFNLTKSSPATLTRSARGRPKAWPYCADPPQRYWGNYGGRYTQRGGRVDLEQDIQDFVTGGHDGDVSRFYFSCLAFDQIRKEGLKGDIAELGVYRSHTASLIAKMARRLDRTAFLQDSFEQFHQPDLGSIDANQTIQFADTSLDAVEALVGEDSVKFIKLDFPGTAIAFSETSFCLIQIDCDLYISVCSALKYLYLRLIRRAHQPNSQPGAVGQKRPALFPDRWTFAGHGQRADALVEEWGGQEPWGVRGVGSHRKLGLCLPERLDDDFSLDFDVHARLSPHDPGHLSDVSVEGRSLGLLLFTSNKNRGVQSIVVRRDLVPLDMAPSIVMQFRPQRTVRSIDYNPTGGDIRDLGLAPHRIRVRLP